MTCFRHAWPVAAVAVVSACSAAAPESPTAKAPLYGNLGAYHHAVTTRSPEAQKYFDQGLTRSYAFNHAEAIRSFRQSRLPDALLRKSRL